MLTAEFHDVDAIGIEIMDDQHDARGGGGRPRATAGPPSWRPSTT